MRSRKQHSAACTHSISLRPVLAGTALGTEQMAVLTLTATVQAGGRVQAWSVSSHGLLPRRRQTTGCRQASQCCEAAVDGCSQSPIAQVSVAFLRALERGLDETQPDLAAACRWHAQRAAASRQCRCCGWTGYGLHPGTHLAVGEHALAVGGGALGRVDDGRLVVDDVALAHAANLVDGASGHQECVLRERLHDLGGRVLGHDLAAAVVKLCGVRGQTSSTMQAARRRLPAIAVRSAGAAGRVHSPMVTLRGAGGRAGLQRQRVSQLLAAVEAACSAPARTSFDWR